MPKAKKRTELEAWLNLPANYCLFSPVYKKPRRDQSKATLLARADQLKEVLPNGAKWVFTYDGIAYYKNTSSDLEILAIETENYTQVGKLETTLIDEEPWLDYIEVDEAYQRKGIGTRLIRTAVKHHPDLQIPPGNGLKYDEEGTLFLTTEGAALVSHCLNIKILNYERNCATADNYVPETEQDMGSSPSQSC